MTKRALTATAPDAVSTPETQVKAKRRDPTPHEVDQARRAAEWLAERGKTARLAPEATVVLKPGEVTRISSENTDDDGYTARMAWTLETPDAALVNMFTAQLACATGRDEAASMRRGLAFVAGIAPENEIETALAVQMYASHSLSVSLADYARRADTVDELSLYVSLMMKSQRLFGAQAETLTKIRTAGKQTVEVVHVHKHVYVAPGGQAIVGDVHQQGGGGGAFRETGANPTHKPLAYDPGAPLPPVWSPDASGEPLPVSSGAGPQTMSDARGD